MRHTREPSGLVGRARLASALVLASALLFASALMPTQAGAITRSKVLARAHNWVAKKIQYSQRHTYGGYRRDCSGFVSMAWRLGTSYTSRTIHRVAVRIPVSKLRPGDAVHTPGHVAIFVRWKNKAKRTYVAMEESRSGRPALHRVRNLGRGATGLRYRRITDTPRIVRVAAPSVEASPVVALLAGTPSVELEVAAF